MTHLNQKLYTDLPIDELDGRLAVEELEERLELRCWVNACLDCPSNAANCPQGYTCPNRTPCLY